MQCQGCKISGVPLTVGHQVNKALVVTVLVAGVVNVKMMKVELFLLKRQLMGMIKVLSIGVVQY